ncbi:glucuronyl hydrolase [Echinicola strongylocentroti]|uniref:Glucuronyl hydrolase n=1 Tax=Echinicola strongylocentroti TaxID=1795355 RepID=A0A2Z4IPN1_9BACT|nr:glycoside hydrolase family 88 protein [Echinicola strongylocentroti]AWW32865.1 glucuronyl hydrolase [Echinicola strongylocentroti]
MNSKLINLAITFPLKSFRIIGIWLFGGVLLLVFESANAQMGERDFYAKELDKVVLRMQGKLAHLALDSTRIPRSLTSEGCLVGVGSRDWTSGFFPGTLWYLYGYSGNRALLSAARSWTAFIEKEKYDEHTHDTGFKVYCSFGNAYRIQGMESDKDVIVQAAKSLMSRFDPNLGCIRSWDFNQEVWQYPVIIDNMMNLEMLFAATRISGDSIYYQVGKKHAETTLKNHFKEDYSSYHVVDYDTISGMPRLKTTHQGFGESSSWARGQAWALYGFTMCYRETGDPKFLELAQKIAQYILHHPRLPDDKVPYWDFDDPDIPDTERDASAAAVIASALLELSTYSKQEKSKVYWHVADTILHNLSGSEYRLKDEEAPFFLDHSVGSKPHGSEVDVPLVYADYYYVEALIRANNHIESKLY